MDKNRLAIYKDNKAYEFNTSYCDISEGKISLSISDVNNNNIEKISIGFDRAIIKLKEDKMKIGIRNIHSEAYTTPLFIKLGKNNNYYLCNVISYNIEKGSYSDLNYTTLTLNLKPIICEDKIKLINKDNESVELKGLYFMYKSYVNTKESKFYIVNKYANDKIEIKEDKLYINNVEFNKSDISTIIINNVYKCYIQIDEWFIEDNIGKLNFNLLRMVDGK